MNNKRNIPKRQTKGFGWRLMTKRKERGLSLAHVSKILRSRDICISDVALSALERGVTKRVHVDLLLALADILSADVAELLKGEPEHAA